MNAEGRETAPFLRRVGIVLNVMFLVICTLNIVGVLDTLAALLGEYIKSSLNVKRFY